MLITGEEVKNILNTYNISISGALHIGAHECEELPFYLSLGINSNNIIWIDAIQSKVDEAKTKGVHNVYQAVITHSDDDTISFNVTNNIQSSSILHFGSHTTHHPHVHFVDTISLKTVTIDTFFKRNNLNPKTYNFWNIDIQGAELLALSGGLESLKYVKAIYLEVNTEEVYKGCARIEDLDKLLSFYRFKRVKTLMTEYGWGDALYIHI
jgi:FkbM family methyltransferase